jgi:hypothetical protein
MTREELRYLIQRIKENKYLTRNETNYIIKALEQEPCEDCVSRKRLMDNYNGVETPVGYKKVVDLEVIKNMQPVRPIRKKGKWIGTCKIGFGEFAEYEVELIDGFVADNCHCSECGEELEKGERGIYCPNCGSRNEVEK